MSMDQKYETLKFLVTTHRSEFEKRRSYQWKGVVGVITLMVLFAAAKVVEKTSQGINEIPDVIVWCSLLGVALITSFILLYAYKAHAFNKAVAHRAEEALEKLMNGKELDQLDLYATSPKNSFKVNLFTVGQGRYWGWLFESIVVFAFAIISAHVITS